MAEEDLYAVLGVPQGVDGSQLTQLELKKAYRKRAIERHPDKRPASEKAAAEEEFHKLQTAYDVLSDEKARKAYDDVVRMRKERLEKLGQLGAKRQKMMKDLEEKEAAYELQRRQKAEEEKADNTLKQELERIRAAARAKRASMFQRPQPATTTDGESTSWMDEEDRQKTLKVTWDASSGEYRYDKEKLREIFGKFGGVEDVLIEMRKSKKKGSALIVMESAAAAHAATQTQCGYLSNPLLVLPLDVTSKVPSRRQPVSTSTPPPSSHSQVNEDSIMEKLRKAAERKRKAETGNAQP